MHRTTLFAAGSVFMVALLLSVFPSSPAQADDCRWAQRKLENYQAACSAIDGCRHRTQMTASVAAQCGHTTDRASAPSDGEGNDGGGDPGAGSGTLGPRDPSAYEKPPELEDYTGESCVYFTRPTWERDNGVLRRNKYADGSNVCYRNKLYECVKGRWSRPRPCPSSVDARRYDAHRIEGTQPE